MPRPGGKTYYRRMRITEPWRCVLIAVIRISKDFMTWAYAPSNNP